MHALKIFSLIVLYICFCQAAATTLQIQEYATGGNQEQYFPAGKTQNAAAGNAIFVYDSYQVIVFLRDAQGTYKTRTYIQQWIESPTPLYITTNGKWFATLRAGYRDVKSFQLGPTGTFDNITEFPSKALFMQFLSDDSLVLYDTNAIDTYEFIAGTWTKIQSQPANFTVKTGFTLAGDPNDGTLHMTDTTLAAYHPRGAVELYTRNTDKTWSLVDEISIDTLQYRANRILWNGGDTVILSHTTYINQINGRQGRVLVFVKTGGVWALARTIDASGLGIPAPAYFGYSMLLVDSNTFAVGAPSDASNKGDVFIVHRDAVGGSWEIITRIIGRDTRNYFGYTLMKTNTELVIQTQDTLIVGKNHQVVVPGCSLPLSYSCSDVVLDTCQSDVDVPYNQLYTLRDECTRFRLQNVRVNSQSSTFTFGFTRENATTVSCNSTITCLSPPMAAPTAPVSPPALPISSPVSVPTTSPSSTTPVGSPVTTPTSPPTATPVSTPVGVPVDSPMTPPTTAPVSSPLAVPVPTSPTSSPVKAPNVSPVTSPISTSVPVPDQSDKVSNTGAFCRIVATSFLAAFASFLLQ